MFQTRDETERFDHSLCSVCGITFLGVKAFDAHRPCQLPLDLSRYRVYSGKYVLAEDAERYEVRLNMAAKAREGRTKNV